MQPMHIQLPQALRIACIDLCLYLCSCLCMRCISLRTHPASFRHQPVPLTVRASLVGCQRSSHQLLPRPSEAQRLPPVLQVQILCACLLLGAPLRLRLRMLLLLGAVLMMMLGALLLLLLLLMMRGTGRAAWCVRAAGGSWGQAAAALVGPGRAALAAARPAACCALLLLLRYLLLLRQCHHVCTDGLSLCDVV
jgi:hypothetical protein